MIVCRKPWRIYDIDVIGIAAIVGLGLVAYFGIVIPARADTQAHRDASAKLKLTSAALQQSHTRLERINGDIAALRAGVDGQIRQAPKLASLTAFLNRTAALAEACELEIAQVVPRPTKSAVADGVPPGVLVSDVNFVARGSSLALARFLDALTLENPYHTVRDFSIRSSREPDDPRCTLAWTLRLYMLPDDPSHLTGDTP